MTPAFIPFTTDAAICGLTGDGRLPRFFSSIAARILSSGVTAGGGAGGVSFTSPARSTSSAGVELDGLSLPQPIQRGAVASRVVIQRVVVNDGPYHAPFSRRRPGSRRERQR